MRQQLYIDDQEIELVPGSVIQETKQIADIGELMVMANHTNRFKAVLSEINNTKLERSDKVQSDSNIPYSITKAVISRNGIQTVRNGRVVVESVDDFYNIEVFSGNFNFFDDIQGKSIKDIDWSDLIHERNLNNISNSFLDTLIGDFFYPLINFGRDFQVMPETGNDVDAEKMYPAVKVSLIIDRIFSEARYLKSGDIFSNSEYLNMVIPVETIIQYVNARYDIDGIFNSSGKNFTHPSFLKGYWFIIPGTTLYGNPVFLQTKFGRLIIRRTVNITGAEFGLVFDPVDFAQTFQIPISGKVRVTLSITIEATSAPPGGAKEEFPYFSVNKYNTTPDPITGAFTHRLTNSIGTKFTGIGQSRTMTLDETFDMSKDDYIWLEAGVFFDYVAPTTNYRHTNYFFEIDILGETEAEYLESFDVGNNLPDISQKGMLEFVIKWFGLMLQADTDTDTLNFTQNNKIKNNFPQKKDWSDKIDKSVQHKILYHDHSFAQTNWFQWEKNEEVEAELGDSSLDVNDQSLDLEVERYKAEFSATRMMKCLDGVDVPQIIFWQEDDNDVLEFDPAEVTPRILIFNPTDLPDPYDFNSVIEGETYSSTPGLNEVPLAYFILDTETITFDWAYAIITHYDQMSEILNKYKKVIVNLVISDKDFESINHFIPLYIRQFGSSFFINLVDKYTEGSTTFELIRI